jgi:hypothetical protein
MKLPIIIDESGDILVFDSLESAERHLEPIDILNGEFVGYDAEGRLLNIVPNGFIAKISLAELEPTHADNLEKVLRDLFLDVDPSPEWVINASLEELIQKVLKYYKFR